jgi:hypothetical protein
MVENEILEQSRLHAAVDNSSLFSMKSYICALEVGEAICIHLPHMSYVEI